MPFREIKGAEYCEFNKGDIVINIDEEVKYLYYITDGVVEMFHCDCDGEEQKLYIKNNGKSLNSLIGIMLIYSVNDYNISQYLFKAKTECKCYKIPVSEYMSWARGESEILEQHLRMYKTLNLELSQRFRHRCEGNSTMEVCKFLYANLEQTGNGVYVKKSIKQTNIANLLGIHKITLAKIIKALKDEGVVAKDKNGFQILDIDKLIAHAKREKLKYS